MINDKASLRQIESLDPIQLYPSLRLAIYECIYRCARPLVKLDYFGSTWRGAFGNALRRLCCPWGSSANCSTCQQSDTCAYHLCYEKKSDEPGFPNPPRPYIVNPLPLEESSLVKVKLTLIGTAADYAPSMLVAMQMAGENGIGKGRIRCDLAALKRALPSGHHVDIGTPEGKNLPASFLLAQHLRAIAVPPSPWRVKILHPLRIRKNGQDLRHLDWVATWKSFAIRLALLSNLYNSGERLPQADWQALLTFLAKLGVSQGKTQIFSWRRYSSTQKRHVRMDGLTQDCLISPPSGLEHLWWRWWQAAALLHVGKGANMGMGWIQIAGVSTAHLDKQNSSFNQQGKHHAAHSAY